MQIGDKRQRLVNHTVDQEKALLHKNIHYKKQYSF